MTEIGTFEELYKQIKEKGHLWSVPEEEGIYKVYMPKGFKIYINDYTVATKAKRIYEVERLQNKWQRLKKSKETDKNVLYIGKAKKGKKSSVRTRIEQFVKFAYGDVSNHQGGKALFQLSDCYRLKLAYELCQHARDEEKAMILDFEGRNGSIPFANMQH